MSQEVEDPRFAVPRVPIAPTVERHPDRELAEAVLRRDRKATAEFVARFSDAVYAYVRRRLLPRIDLVDDLVQEVFIAALENLGTFAGASSLRTWLLGIARHKIEDHYRECLKEHATPLDEDASPVEDVRMGYDELLDGERQRERVQQILADLPPAYRAVLRWRYWDRRSAQDMATRSGRSAKAIERLLARARHEFRRRWTET
jgi:RNA polymerase sigma-70 factor (ECF subfamily)